MWWWCNCPSLRAQCSIQIAAQCVNPRWSLFQHTQSACRRNNCSKIFRRMNTGSMDTPGGQALYAFFLLLAYITWLEDSCRTGSSWLHISPLSSPFRGSSLGCSPVIFRSFSRLFIFKIDALFYICLFRNRFLSTCFLHELSMLSCS